MKRLGNSKSIFAGRLLRAREERRWGQQAAADACGLPVATYRNYEYTHREPGFKGVGKTVSWLLGKDNECNAKETVVKISTQWFQDRIKASKHGSQRQLAFAIGIDPASLSYALNGKRRLQIHEAEAIANALSVPLAEVLTHVGIGGKPKKTTDPYLNVPSDVKRGLAKFSPTDPIWDMLRAYIKTHKD